MTEDSVDKESRTHSLLQTLTLAAPAITGGGLLGGLVGLAASKKEQANIDEEYFKFVQTYIDKDDGVRH